MKILMVGPFPGQISGMTLANKMLYDGLVKNGHKVNFIDTNTDREFTDLKKQGKFKVSKVFLSLSPICKGIYNIVFRKYDVIYITPAQSYIGFMKYIPFIKASNMVNTPCYLHFHGGFVKKMYDSVGKKQKNNLKKYLNLSNGVIVLGNSLKYMLENIIPNDKILVCENGVESSYILTEDELNNKIDRLKNSNEIKIFYLSNLMKTKGILELLNACKILKNNNINFKLEIAGAIEPGIESEVKELFAEIGNNIIYHGTVNGNDKRELLIRNEIFCLPTYYPNEGQPISILEAMLTGNAIVTTYQGGICDIFKEKINGEVCEPNEESIYKAIIDAKDNIIEYSKSNCKIANDLYTDNMFVKRIEKILES